MTSTETYQIEATDRHLSTREVDGQQAIVTTISREYDTAPEDLWDAVTNAERLPRWFAPVSGDLQLGGRYQIEGNAAGEIIACDPPRSFQITWEFADNTSWVTVVISDGESGGAQFALEHVGHIPADFWEQYGSGATGVGWDLGLLGLAQHVADPDGERPDEETWASSEAGQAFITASSRRWTEASIAFGADPDQAAAAGERTTAFFTGAEA